MASDQSPRLTSNPDQGQRPLSAPARSGSSATQVMALSTCGTFLGPGRVHLRHHRRLTGSPSSLCRGLAGGIRCPLALRIASGRSELVPLGKEVDAGLPVRSLGSRRRPLMEHTAPGSTSRPTEASRSSACPQGLSRSQPPPSQGVPAPTRMGGPGVGCAGCGKVGRPATGNGGRETPRCSGQDLLRDLDGLGQPADLHAGGQNASRSAWTYSKRLGAGRHIDTYCLGGWIVTLMLCP
jgi:hypothetical protein